MLITYVLIFMLEALRILLITYRLQKPHEIKKDLKNGCVSKQEKKNER